jgi:hypothetical protein
MRSEIHIVPNSPTLGRSTVPEAVIAASSDPSETATAQAGREPFARFRRFRADAHVQVNGETVEDEVALKLHVMLLSEENARLKAARHRPSDIGTLIDQMRLLGAQEGEGEVLDEAWTMLSECLVIREGLEQACIEIQAAIGDVRARLGSLAIRLDDVTPANCSDRDVARRHVSPSR